MDKRIETLRETYAELGKEPERLHLSLNLTHKQRNATYADFVRTGFKPEVADVMEENGDYMGYLSTILSSYRVPDFVYSKAIAMLYNSHRTVLPVVGREYLETLYRQKLDCIRTAFRELKKHPNKAGMKVKDIKEIRDMVEDELNEILAKQGESVK